MSWYKIPLSNEQITNGVGSKIQTQFQALFITSGQPKDMALFSSKDNVSGVQLFLSPASFPTAAGLVVSYSGVPCDKPPRQAITLLCGLHTSSDSLL